MGIIDTLKIKNLALIEDIEIEFSKGLNIITGETGAGKSIIVNSLQLIIGKRASSDIIRANEDMCEVEAIFDLEDYDDYLIVKRILTKNNKNKIKINDNFSTLNNLKEITYKLIDFSEQNQYLFDDKNQLIIYDLYCGIKDDVNEFKKLYSEYLDLKNKIEDREKEKDKAKEKLEYLKYQLQQLESINLEEIDEYELKKEITYFENSEIIKSTLDNIIAFIDNNFSNLANFKQKISEIKNIKPIFNEIYSILENVEIEIGEISNLCFQELKGLPDDLSQLDELILLQEKINNLKKKHNKETIEELIELKKSLKQEINELENYEIYIADEKKKLNELSKKLKELSEKLHNIRLKNKEKFEKEIIKILKQLKMENVKFVVSIKESESFSNRGRDRVEFLISTNAGETPKPIKNIASGGEKSRVMLALKSFLSEQLEIPILIFDEIDAGTGGETAFAIGKLLKKLSNNHQVFAITHFPQVAAFADSHYKVFKETTNGKTITRIKKLNYREKIEELARMISGNITEASKKSAEELINEAEKSNS